MFQKKPEGSLKESVEILVFRLGESLFGVRVQNVKRVMPSESPEPVEKLFPSLEGVLRLAEGTVPAVDFFRKLKLEPVPADPLYGGSLLFEYAPSFLKKKKLSSGGAEDEAVSSAEETKGREQRKSKDPDETPVFMAVRSTHIGDVLTLSPEEILKIPQSLKGIRTGWAEGIVLHDSKQYIVVLRPENIVTGEEWRLIKRICGGSGKR